MCIIVFKPYDAELPTEDILFECFWSNPHGAGYMVRNDSGKVVIHKGFMTVNALLESLDTIRDIEDQDIAIHFRYATHGGKTAGETHPFPITHNIDLLRRRKVICDKAIMHNGIISDMKHKDETLSDTMCLVKILSGTDEFSEHMQKTLNAGKFLIMDKDETRFYGGFIKEKGCLFSNTSYQPKVYYLSRYSNYDLLGSGDYNKNIASDKYDAEMIGDAEEQERLLEWYNNKYGTRYYDVWELLDDLEVLADLEEYEEDVKRIKNDLFMRQWKDSYDY